jgi:hypothetical protein
MGCLQSCPVGQQFVIIGIPILIPLIGVIGYFVLKHSGHWDDLMERTACFRTFCTQCVYVCLGFITWMAVINSYANLFEGNSLRVSPPSGLLKNRCIPLFSAAQLFADRNEKTSIIYQFDSTGRNFHTAVRICTNATRAVVSSFAESNDFKLQPTFPSTANCPWEIIARNCEATNGMTCAQLLNIPPLPNGFLYRTKNPFFWPADPPSPPDCKNVFKHMDDLPACSNQYVFVVENELASGHLLGGAIALAYPIFVYYWGIWTFWKFCCCKKREDITQADENALAFLSKTPMGRIYFLRCCEPYPQCHLTMFYFLFLSACAIVEIVVFIVQITPCCICGQQYEFPYESSFIGLYYLILLKIVLLCLDVKEYICDNPPLKQESERIENLAQHANSGRGGGEGGKEEEEEEEEEGEWKEEEEEEEEKEEEEKRRRRRRRRKRGGGDSKAVKLEVK